MGVIAVLLIVFVLLDPERGKSEGSDLKPTTWGNDLREVLKK
jgi:preprotein translocase subunit SecG